LSIFAAAGKNKWKSFGAEARILGLGDGDELLQQTSTAPPAASCILHMQLAI
jgi:hypothetical protein